jgi:hypothetical protein
MRNFISCAKVEQLRFGFSDIFVIAKFAQIYQPDSFIHRVGLSCNHTQPIAHASAWLDLCSSNSSIAVMPARSGNDFNISNRPARPPNTIDCGSST